MVDRIEITVETEEISIGKMKYGWSKWGGPMYGLVKDEQDWFCQACSKPQPKEMPNYMLPIDRSGREFVRICSICKHIQLQNKISYYQLIQLVRNDL